MLYNRGMDAINAAIESAGGCRELAGLIGVTPQFVWQMQKGKRKVPPTLCAQIEAKTGVRREALRPDVFGPVAA